MHSRWFHTGHCQVHLHQQDITVNIIREKTLEELKIQPPVQDLYIIRASKQPKDCFSSRWTLLNGLTAESMVTNR